MLKKSIGGYPSYSGWKGGMFAFSDDETLHIDNYGDSTQTGITRVEDCDWEIILHTKKGDIQ